MEGKMLKRKKFPREASLVLVRGTPSQLDNVVPGVDILGTVRYLDSMVSVSDQVEVERPCGQI